MKVDDRIGELAGAFGGSTIFSCVRFVIFFGSVERRGHTADTRRRVLTGAVLDRRELELVRDRVGGVDVGQTPGGRLDDTRDTGAAAGADARRPADARVDSHVALERALTAERYSVKLYVVPEPSER